MMNRDAKITNILVLFAVLASCNAANGAKAIHRKPVPGHVAPGKHVPARVAHKKPVPFHVAPGKPVPHVAPKKRVPARVTPGKPVPGHVAPKKRVPVHVAPGKPVPVHVAPGKPGPICGAPGPVTTFNAFIKAWRAACDFNGNSQLLIPPGVFTLGETVFQGPCKSPTPMTVVLQGTLEAVSDVSAYTGKGWITFEEVNGLTLTGGGIVNGQGQNVWQYNDCKTNPDCTHLVASIYMSKVKNAKIEAINLVNSMGFHMHITNSDMVEIIGVTITSPPTAPNTDGMHISRSNKFRVSRTLIKTGDDCISLGQGAHDVTVNEVTCGPGHGISVGSLGKLPDEWDVTGLLVKNCTLIGTSNGIRIKTYAGSAPSKASGLTYQDVIMDNVKNPIIIDQHYGSDSNKKPSQVKISDIFFQNIRGTTTTPVAVSLDCSSQVPCQNLHLNNINLQFRGKGKLSSKCTNAKVRYFGVQNPPTC